METPCYIFDAELFRERLRTVKDAFGDVSLTFSVKANPFLLSALPGTELINYVEACSPGELEICKQLDIGGERIIYSGVMKEEHDIRSAIAYGAAFVTAESKRHYGLILKASKELDKKVRLLLRLSSGNQFGMSEKDILEILSEKDRGNIEIAGFHYYSGTAKNKQKQLEKDIATLKGLISAAVENGYEPELIEYGPGLKTEYYEEPYEDKDRELLSLAADTIKGLRGKYRLGIEMGRFMAAVSGCYRTRVMDMKVNDGVNYVIVDGGIHQLNYYGQNMAMKIPPLKVYRDGGLLASDKGDSDKYCICGSLCTTADVLIREVTLPSLQTGDILSFERAGAYSVTEAPFLFLSRDMPEIWLKDGESLKPLREKKESWRLNC